MRITICGGGSLGHVIAGFIAHQGQHDIRILTRHPDQWNSKLIVYLPDNSEVIGEISTITDDAQVVIPDSDIVLLCAPGFAIRDILTDIALHLSPNTYVGSIVSSTGFFFEAEKVLNAHECVLFGFQRVPFIARVKEYGHSAYLLGYKSSLNLATEHATDKQRSLLQTVFSTIFNIPINLLSSHYEASLTNSNPLLHPARLYTMWHGFQEGDIFSHCPLFYAEWTEEASQLYIDMDTEFQHMLTMLPVPDIHIQDVLSYYESTDAASLTRKLRSIAAFKTIASPMRKIESGYYIPDFSSRYFTEDFPYGMFYILKVAHECNASIPTIEKVYKWGMSMVEK